MNALLLIFALSTPPEVDGVSSVVTHNEEMISEILSTSRGNRFVIRTVMCFDVLGFIVFFLAVRRAANRSKINEEATLLLNTKIDQCLTILRAESTVQCHVLDQAKKLAQDNSIKLDEVKQQIDAQAASIIMESKSASDSVHAMAAVNITPVSDPRGLYSYRSPEP